MGTLVKILVVEDEMLIGAKISLLLTNLGYEVTGILPRGEEALLHIKDNKPDIILLDINLKGDIDGIETAKRLQEISDTAIIYLTANADEATFNRAKTTSPQAFISKPFKQLDLQRAIELTISRMAINENNNNGVPVNNPDTDSAAFILHDRIFIRFKDRMIKILISDILYIEAERNYCRIFTREKEYLLSITLKAFEEKLPIQQFIRIHRSYVINLNNVEEVAEHHVMIAQKAIPLSAALKENLMQHIKTL